MSKFKIGDQVRIIKNDSAWGEGGEHVGKTSEITADDGTNNYQYSLKDIPLDWDDGELELAVKNLDHLEHGDVLVNDDYRYVVVDVFPHSIFYRREEDVDGYDIETIEFMKQDGWKVEQRETTPETTELSVAELEKKLDIPTGTLRVKKDS
jgi:hypothetical protein